MGTDTQEREMFDNFVKLAIEGAKTLLSMAHNIEADISYRMVLKNNGPQPALTFHEEGKNVSPTVYIKSFFDRYKSGEDIGSIVKDLTEAGYQGITHAIDMPPITPEEARRCVRLDLIGNNNKNQELLKDIPHYIIGEGEGALAAFPRWEIDSHASFRVTDEIAAQVQMTPSEMLNLAQENTNKIDYKIDTIGNVLHKLFQDMGTISADMDEMLTEVDPAPQMLVMTTSDCVHGAAAILSHDAMEKAREMLGYEQVFIIPSSIHEVLIVPANGEIKAEDLKEMIMDVNRTQLAPEEILSDFPLKYDGLKISMAIESPKTEMAVDDGMKIEKNMKIAMA